MIVLYKILMNFSAGLFFLLFPLIYLFSEKRRPGLLLRSGFGTAWKMKKPGEKRIWIHALSVGEVRSAAPFVKALNGRHKKAKIIFTASTRTGFETAAGLFSTLDDKTVDQTGYFPFDFGYSVKKTTELISPDAVIIVETDIWPNFLFEMKKRRIPVVLINARLSERSLKGYLWFKSFFSSVFSCFTRIMVQTPLDAGRFQNLGISKENIHVTGNLKFDQVREDRDDSFANGMKKRLNIQAQTLVLIAGSTHEGEETILLKAYEELKIKYPDLMMILAPRDPLRCKSLRPSISSGDIPVSLMSETKRPEQKPGIILVDEMGILSQLYSLCHVAYIGGSLVKEGGHNPLEPAAFSKSVLFGPDMSDFLEIAALMKEHGGARQVSSEKELAHELDSLLGNHDLQNHMGRLNREVFLNHSGAVENIIRNLESLHIV